MKYRKKFAVEAFRWGLEYTPATQWPEWFNEALVKTCFAYPTGALGIQTLEGLMTCGHGDWVIRGIKGELYPCKNDIFEMTYEAYDDQAQARWDALYTLHRQAFANVLRESDKRDFQHARAEEAEARLNTALGHLEAIKLGVDPDSWVTLEGTGPR